MNQNRSHHSLRWVVPDVVSATCLLWALSPAAAEASKDGSWHHSPPSSQQPPTAIVGAIASLGGALDDVPLVDQNGQPVRFYSDLIEDKVVAINFIFTTCTTVCPPLGASFGRLRALLGNRVGDQVQLISVSIDPVVDTPQRLKEWGQRFGAGPGWTLVTGPKLAVDRLLKTLQVFTPEQRDHAPIVFVGDGAKNQWMRAYGLASPRGLAEIVQGLLSARRQGGQR